MDKTDLLDVTFQAAILKQHIRIEHFFLLHLNREYLRGGDLVASELFIIEDITGQVSDLLPVVETARSAALLAVGEVDPSSAGWLPDAQAMPVSRDLFSKPARLFHL